MTEREKVINGLEQFKADFKPFCGNSADWERFDAGLSMLKEQEAVEPKVEKAILDYQSWHYICGDCGGKIDINDNYCRHCGRVVAHICNYNERKDGDGKWTGRWLSNQ